MYIIIPDVSFSNIIYYTLSLKDMLLTSIDCKYAFPAKLNVRIKLEWNLFQRKEYVSSYLDNFTYGDQIKKKDNLHYLTLNVNDVTGKETNNLFKDIYTIFTVRYKNSEMTRL